MEKTLRELFVDRLKDELEERKISVNGLARLVKGDVGYGSVSRILAGKQDPTLAKVEALAKAVGLPAWALMVEAGQVEQRVIRPPQNVVKLPNPYPKIFPPASESPSKAKAKKRR